MEDTHIFGVDNFSDGATQDDFELELSKYEELIRSALDAGIVVYREGLDRSHIRDELENICSTQFSNIEEGPD